MTMQLPEGTYLVTKPPSWQELRRAVDTSEPKNSGAPQVELDFGPSHEDDLSHKRAKKLGQTAEALATGNFTVILISFDGPFIIARDPDGIVRLQPTDRNNPEQPASASYTPVQPGNWPEDWQTGVHLEN